MKEILKKLVEVSSPSGREEKVRTLILETIKEHIDDYKIDPLGNLIAHKKGPGKKLLFDAHMDEIGFLATYIDDNGFIRMEPVGGHEPMMMPSQRVIFEYGTVGVFYLESELVAEKRNDWKNLSFDTLFVDIGATSRNEALAKVRIGEMATFERNFLDMGKRMMSKAMDDRIGCAILIEVIKSIRNPQQDLYFVFAAQEEVGLVGAKTAAYQIEPDFGIAVDITGSGFLDLPKGAKRIPMKLGSGPAIKIQDRSMVANHKFNQFIASEAEKLHIPYQYEVLPFGGTDGGVIQTTKAGVKTTTISIPTRYGHSPSEVVDTDDVNHTIQLLLHIAETPINLE